MNSARKFLLSTIAIFFTFFTVTAAAGSETPTKVYSLGEVVVSGGVTGTQVNTGIEIDSELLERKNIQSLDKALELLPGIDVTKGNAGKPRVNIRGLRSRHTIILLNGIPLNSTWDQQFDPHLIPVENISKIKVSYGTHSVLYGQGGLAGVINIITKQGTTGVHGDLTAQIDERGNHYSRTSFSGGKNKFDFFAGVSQNHTKGLPLSENFNSTPYEDGGLRENSDDKKLNVFGNLGFEVNEELQLGLTLGHGNGEFGIVPNTKDNTDPMLDSKVKYERVEDFETFSSQLSADYNPRGLLGFRGWVFINNHKEAYAKYDDADYSTQVRRGSYNDDTETNIQGGTLQTRLDFKTAGMLILSLSGQEDEYTSDLAKVEVNNNPPVTYYNEYNTELYSTAFEYRVSPVKGLDMVAGFSHHWYEKEIGNDDNDSGYMIGTSFDVTPKTVLRASYARKIRFPSIRQLYDSSSGDNALKPEKANNYEAGINQKLPWDVELDMAFFLSDVENYIEKDSSNTFANNDEYRFKGIEARVIKSILENGKVSLSYSWLDAHDKSSGTSRDELQYRPEHKFVVDVNYTFSFGLTTSVDYTYISKQYFYNDAFDKDEISDYSIVNLKLEQKVYKGLSVFIGADNLFDENYEESYGLNQPGRTAYAGMTFKF